MAVFIKRVYDSPADGDGKRILIDRLWPRGVSKQQAAVDLWLKEAAPSNELRKWFSHDPAKWQQFQARYLKELKANEAVVASLREEIKRGTVTLLYGAKDEQHNNAVALKKYIEQS